MQIIRNDLMNKEIIDKYNVPGPRYTSYPTVPFWKESNFNQDNWKVKIQQNLTEFSSKELSLYIHLPFCESLCTFCGCHKRITKNHGVELPYIEAVIKEWKMYSSLLPADKVIKELHFGGGTPTFMSPDNLILLLEALFDASSVDSTIHELSFEAHPNNTSEEHLEKLYGFGFRRLSLGIQSYSPTVQIAIHRIQPFENVEKVHNMAREMGYISISHDLVFGLPKQTIADMLDTVEKTLTLKPDRISLYSYAHVPWIKGNGQRGYDENDLPQGEDKRALYEVAKEKLENFGYIEVGMDHFALPEDSLAIAMKNKSLHRNFMGYTTQNTPLLIGLGMSAISDAWFGFAQNEKSLEAYTALIVAGEMPVVKGHILTDEELIIRRNILELMCQFSTIISKDLGEERELILARLKPLEEDGLIKIEGANITIHEEAIPFVRNVCMAFDLDLARSQSNEKMFSQTI